MKSLVLTTSSSLVSRFLYSVQYWKGSQNVPMATKIILKQHMMVNITSMLYLSSCEKIEDDMIC